MAGRGIEIWAGINGEKEIYLALYIFVSVILIRHDGWRAARVGMLRPYYRRGFAWFIREMKKRGAGILSLYLRALNPAVRPGEREKLGPLLGP